MRGLDQPAKILRENDLLLCESFEDYGDHFVGLSFHFVMFLLKGGCQSFPRLRYHTSGKGPHDTWAESDVLI